MWLFPWNKAAKRCSASNQVERDKRGGVRVAARAAPDPSNFGPCQASHLTGPEARFLLREHLNAVSGFAALLADDRDLNERQHRFAINILTAGRVLQFLLMQPPDQEPRK
jgi:hypothetical protein